MTSVEGRTDTKESLFNELALGLGLKARKIDLVTTPISFFALGMCLAHHRPEYAEAWLRIIDSGEPRTDLTGSLGVFLEGMADDLTIERLLAVLAQES